MSEASPRADRPGNRAELTVLLSRVRSKDRKAFDCLYQLAYPRILEYACRLMQAQPPNHTLDSGGLANESYLRLLRSRNWDWRNYGHFLAVAFCAMRHQLIDHANGKGCAKRGAGWERKRLTGICVSFEHRVVDLLRLHEALSHFAEIDPDALAVIELKFYSGLPMQEIAECTCRSLRSVERDWKIGRAWLLAELSR